MELVVLGSGGGWARPGAAACGYLVRQDGFTLWLDAGTGTMANLQKHVGLLDVDAVAVSHRHFDHFLDLYPYHLALRFNADRSARVPLFCPPGFAGHAAQLEDDFQQVFEPREVTPGQSFQAGPLAIRTAAMRHPVPTLGMRIEADGSSLAYTADTGPTEDLVQLALGADLLLSEATWLERSEEWGFIHLTATEAGDHARRAGVDRLVLTHIWPAQDRMRSAGMAATAFGREVSVAREGMTVRL